MKHSRGFQLSVALGELRNTESVAEGSSDFRYPEVVQKLTAEAERLKKEGKVNKATNKAKTANRIFWTLYATYLTRGSGRRLQAVR